MQLRGFDGEIQVDAGFPMSTARGMFPGIDKNVICNFEGPIRLGDWKALTKPIWELAGKRKVSANERR